MLIGAALAVAGLFCRASSAIPGLPDVIGITEGASLGAVLFIFIFTGTVSIHWMPLFAILGAFHYRTAVYACVEEWRIAARLVLIGIGVSVAIKSISYMLIISGPPQLADRFLPSWQAKIYGMSWDKDVMTCLL